MPPVAHPNEDWRGGGTDGEGHAGRARHRTRPPLVRGPPARGDRRLCRKRSRGSPARVRPAALLDRDDRGLAALLGRDRLSRLAAALSARMVRVPTEDPRLWREPAALDRNGLPPPPTRVHGRRA